MTCSRCGASSSDGSAYCANCGAPLGAGAAAPAAAETRTFVEPRKRPWLVTLLAVIKFVQAALFLPLAIALGSTAAQSGHGMAFGIACGLGVIALGAAVCGYGLLRLEPYGRYLQIAFSIISLIEIPIQTVISALILVYMFQRGARVLFSRTPVAELSPDDAAALQRVQQPNVAALAIAVSACALLFVMWIGIVAAIAIPNLLNAIDRGEQKRTMADLRSIGTAIESYAVDNNAYPAAQTIEGLRDAVQPAYIKALPLTDGWGHPFRIEASPAAYTVWSAGKDGRGADCSPAMTVQLNDEICFANGQFVRYPSGSQH